MQRNRLVPDRLYHVEDVDLFFVSPDGVGGYWFDNMEQVNETYGEGNFTNRYSIETLEDF